MTLYPLKLYFKYRPVAIETTLSVFLNMATFGIVMWYFRRQEEPIFLHYTIIFGVDYLGPWWYAYALPAIGAAIWIVNGTLGWLLFQREKFFSLILGATGVLCQIFLLLAAGLLVFLNS